MCGICGIIDIKGNEVDKDSINIMMKMQKHRGPDDEGTYFDKNVGLGFVRLSIIDLTLSGHQPMTSNDSRYSIVFNGEIYNYIELKSNLEKKGYLFKSSTDTEVLLYSYIEWGNQCLHHLNGMWSFAIFDKQNQTIFAARDRFGIKPLYYLHNADTFAFASEIPPLLTLLNSKATPDKQSIFDYLAFNRTDQTNCTFFSEIKKIQHGEYALINTSSSNFAIDIKQWYNLRSEIKNPFISSDQFIEMLSSSIGLRLRSDVPVGVCLSGGLDSSSIVSILLKDYKKDDLQTFSAVYIKGQAGDESEYINEFSSVLNHMHFTSPSASSLKSDLTDFLRAHAEPIPSTSPYAQFKVMELAKGNIVVTLDGQGADEELAGYHYFFGFYFKDLLREKQIRKLFREMYHYVKVHKSLFGIKTFLFFLLPEKMRTTSRIKEKAYIDQQFIKEYKKTNRIAGNLYGSKTLNDALADHFEFKLEHLLKWEDRNSMWFSLEARVPFLDYRIVERILATPGDKIIKKGMTKYILREGMKSYLPEKIRLRKDKVGFGTPEDEWFRTPEWQDITFSILNSDSFKNRNLIKPEVAIKQYKKHISGKINISKEIWKWINLELWFRTFIDNETKKNQIQFL